MNGRPTHGKATIEYYRLNGRRIVHVHRHQELLPQETVETIQISILKLDNFPEDAIEQYKLK